MQKKIIFKTLKKFFSGFLIFSIISLLLVIVKEKSFAAENLQIFGENISGKKGDEKNFQIKVKNFKNVAGLQIFLEFDKNFLGFEGMNYNKFSSTNGVGGGKINLVWDDFIHPVTLGDGEKILDLKFKILGESGESEIKFSPKTKFFNSNGDEIISEKINGKITENTEVTQNNTQLTSISSSGGGGGGGSFGLTVGNFTLSATSKRDVTTFDNIDLKKIEAGTLPVQIKMQDTGSKYSATFQKDTKITTEDGKIFTGKLEAPKRISNTKMPKVNGKNIALRALEIGNSEERLFFSKPITIEFSTAGLSKNAIRENIFPYSWNEKEKKYILEDKNRVVDAKNEKISFEANHATKFILSYGKISGADNSSQNFSYGKTKFKDISSHWAKNFIENLTQRGIFKNQENFRPNDNMTRAELVKVVVEGFNLGKSENLENINFFDIQKNSWYANYLSKAVEIGIIDGPGKNKNFRPGDGVNRAEAMKIILTAAGVKDFSDTSENFSDVQSNQWFANYVNFAYKKGIVSGYGNGKFGPGNFVTRGQVAKIIFNSIEKFGK